MKKTIILFIVSVVILSIGLSLIPSLLNVHNPCKNADIIIVLSGGKGDRVKKGVELYQKKIAPTILMTGGPKYDTSNAQLMKNYALKHYAIAQKDILVEHLSTSTYENALYCLPILQQRHIRSAVIVTSRFHSYRSYKIFKTVFPDTMTLYIVPAGPKVQSFFWWTDIHLLEQYGIEFFKLIIYFLKYF